MSLPKPAKPTSPPLSAPNQQFHRHLPSPAKPHFHKKSKAKHTTLFVRDNEEKKQGNYSHNYAKVFNPTFNTKHINWNELHYIAVHKGRIIFVSNIITTHYPSYLTNYNISNKHSLPPIPNLSSKILHFIHKILSETDTVQRAHTLLHSHSNWETQVDNHDNISVYYRKEGSTNDIHSIKISYSSHCHPVDFIAVVNEFDLIKEIVTIVPMETQYLKEWTNLNKVLYSKVHMWWPLKHRDAIVHVRAYDLLSEYDEIIICGKSCDQIKLNGVNMPILDNKTTRLDVRMGRGAIRPKLMDNGDIGTQITAVFNVDFKTVLPKTLMNWITRTFAYYACKMIRERTEHLEGTTHQQRINQKEIYKEWKRNFVEWKKKKISQQ